MARDPEDRWLLWRTGIKIILILFGITLFFSAWGSWGDGAGFLGLNGMSSTFLPAVIGIILLRFGARGVQQDVRAVIEKFRGER